MNSDSSVEDILPWDQLNYSLTPIYKRQTRSRLNKSSLKLPRLKRPNCITPTIKIVGIK